MSRDEGFTVADVSTAHHDDPKVKALWRAVQDSDEMNAAMTLLEATILVSWREGVRVSAGDACPVWILDTATPITQLQAANLLDAEAKIPPHSWRKWFGAAKKRRDKSRADWRVRKERSRSRMKVTPESRNGHGDVTRDSRTPSVRPSVPTDRLSSRARARGTGQMTRASEVLAGELDPSVRAGLALLDQQERERR